MRRVWTSLVVLALAVGLTPDARGQIQLASRGPKFLSARTVAGERIDASGAAVLRRRVAVAVTGVTVEAALKEIARQADLELIFTRTVLPHGRTVTLHATDITVAGALTVALLDTGLDVLLLPGGQMGIVPRAEPVGEAAQRGAVVGRVTDGKTQTAIAGATVIVEGTQRSATTANDGRYRIADLAPGTYTLRARYIGYAPASASATVSADQEATADFALEKSVQRLDEVVTTGTVVSTEVKALPSPISVITADEIHEKHIQRIDQLFRGDVPGMIANDLGSGDQLTRIFARGASDLSAIGEIKTYVDGVEVNSSSYLSAIDPNSIDRIEVIRGPQASTIYGSQALNGVIQIFTKKGSVEHRPVVEGRVAAGAIQTQYLAKDAAPTYLGDLSISGGSESLSYNVGAGHSYVGEWIEQYRNPRTSTHASLSGRQGWLAVDVFGRFDWQTFGTPFEPLYQRYSNLADFSKPFDQDGNYEDGALGVTLKARVTPRWQHEITVGADRLLQEYKGTAPRFTTPADSLLTLFHDELLKLSLVYTTTLQGSLSRGVAGNITGGVNVASSRYAFFSGSLSPGSGVLEQFSYAVRGVEANRGYFAQGQLGINDALFLTGGVRAESDDYFGENYGVAWSPRAGMSYVQQLKGLTVKARASYGKSIRPPFLTARQGVTYTYAVYLANPNLGPEAQRGVDAGLDFYFGHWGTLQATYYNQTADGLIDKVLLTPGVIPTYQNQNVGEIKNKGVELQGSVSPGHGLTLTATYSRFASKVQRLSPSYTGDLRVGDPLLAIPRYTFGGSLSFAAAGWTANVGVLRNGPWVETDYSSLFDYYYAGQPYRGSGRDYWITYPAFTKLRMALSRRVTADLTAFINVNNLTNSYAYEHDNSTVATGRTTMAGLDFRF